MKRNKFFIIVVAGLVLNAVTSCTKKLDLLPTNDITEQQVYSTSSGYKQAIAKVYAAFALTGNTGGTGSPDIPSQIINDEGNSDFLRLYFNLQELTTDEAAWTWQNDAGVRGLKEMSWSPINAIVSGVYFRAFFQITLANEFIRQASDERLAERNIPAASADTIRKYKTEARFLRAYQYWVLMDLYGNVPFVTETNQPQRSLYIYRNGTKGNRNRTDSSQTECLSKSGPGCRMGLAGTFVSECGGLYRNPQIF
jgi:hypothetical protein